MQLLTATASSQGQRANDFSWTEEGELVTIGFVCAADTADPDGGCGCGRSFTGMTSHKATTTAQVREVDLTTADLVRAVQQAATNGGYELTPEGVAEEVDFLISSGAHWPVGSIVERRLDQLKLRK